MSEPKPGVFELGGDLYYAEYAPENVSIMRGKYTVEGPDMWLVWGYDGGEHFAMTHERFWDFFVPVDVNAYAQYEIAGVDLDDDKAELVAEMEHVGSEVRL